MLKRLIFLIAVVVVTLTAAIPVGAACSIWRRRDPENYKVHTSLSGDNAPIVYIGWSRDHTRDMSFYATLECAEWNYNKNGTIQPGVTYEKVNKNTIEIFVKVGSGENQIRFDYGRNITLPVDCTITEGGEVRLKIESNESSVSNANILIARGIDGRITATAGKARLNNSGYLKKITIKDTSTQGYKANNRFTLTLDSGFKFTGDTDMTTFGKFDNNVTFEVNKGNPSVAYITIKGDTPKQTGEITLENTAVVRNSTKKFNVLLLNVTFKNNIIPLNSNIAAGTYQEDAETITTTQATTAAATEATTEATTASAVTETGSKAEKGSLIEIQIGANSYSINGTSYPLDAPAYVKEGRTMLPLRALANAVGVKDDSITYDAAAKTATLSLGNISVGATAGESRLKATAGDIGKDIAIEAPAEITNGRMFLPLRAIANALGITDEEISYAADTKTVTIVRA